MSNNVAFDRENFKKIRQHRKITLRSIEDSTGISNAYLSQLETGKVTNPSLDVLYKISIFFDLPMDIFVCDLTFSRIRFKSNKKDETF